MTPIADSMIWFQADEVPEHVLEPLRVKSKYEFEDDDEAGVITLYEERDGLIGLPRVYARQWMKPVEMVWNCAKGEYAVFPSCPTARDAEQSEFFDKVLDRVQHSHDTLVQAKTGTGKTVAACYCMHHLAVTTLIVVHMVGLADQWVEEIHEKCGLEYDEIGFVGDSKCDWEGKKVVIGILATLRKKGLPDEFWSRFGFAVIDECHKIPAPKSSYVLKRISAQRRLGLSATPKRKDGLDSILQAHIGSVKIESRQHPVPIRVHVSRFQHPLDEGGKPVTKWPIIARTKKDLDEGRGIDARMAHGIVISALAENQARNDKIANIILQAYNKGRKGIIVSERIEHLHLLREMVIALGIPADDCGMYTAQHVVQDAEGKSKRKKPKRAEIDRQRDECPLVFATYGMVQEAINVTTWNFGIDVTPRASAEQLIGRIRRKVWPGFPALWVTILDLGCPIAEGYFRGRYNEYAICDAEVSGA